MCQKSVKKVLKLTQSGAKPRVFAKKNCKKTNSSNIAEEKLSKKLKNSENTKTSKNRHLSLGK